MPKKLQTKDPDETLAYLIDWSDQLEEIGNDTITGTPTWTLASGITNAGATNTTTTTTILIAGGTHGTDYLVTCRITTTNSQVMEKSFTVPVVSSAV